MRVLVIGSGGREHAIAWRLVREDGVDEVLVAPGNGGTAGMQRVRNCPVGVDDLQGLVDLARTERVDLTIVGPEAPLAAGVVDRFQAAGLKCFGPSRNAAQLESSKLTAKRVMADAGVPTAEHWAFDRLEGALELIDSRPEGALVVKADGLAAGKGVFVCRTREEARSAVRQVLSDFGPAGKRAFIEEFIEGEELSFIALVDGEDVLPLASSQDHKARDDGDAGPNTGGMGAYSPAPLMDDALQRRILDEVMHPTVQQMARGYPDHRFTGFLYAGLMVTPAGEVSVLEFNCRLGDPETQPLLMRLRTPLSQLCLAALEGRLGECALEWDPRPALGVVMASGGYPGDYAKGHPISGALGDSDEVAVFHAGTVRSDTGELLTAGGRVLCVTALGSDLAEAQRTAYERVGRITWRDEFHRSDIGHRGLKR
ncbi:MAG: phosphoribosylamine--glycine ligase [Gammaproteobacteria bacterium AqS3]|nr:phosphoribosylamine--glycine ligase [Gammaproteobacteria bacterium AqS3]